MEGVGLRRFINVDGGIMFKVFVAVTKPALRGDS